MQPFASLRTAAVKNMNSWERGLKDLNTFLKWCWISGTEKLTFVLLSRQLRRLGILSVGVFLINWRHDFFPNCNFPDFPDLSIGHIFYVSGLVKLQSDE